MPFNVLPGVVGLASGAGRVLVSNSTDGSGYADSAGDELGSITWDRLVQVFWLVSGRVDDVLSRWPNFSSTGFAISYSAALLSLPFLLIMALVAVWSIASAGPARKTFSSILIISVGVPVYPIVLALLLALFWIVVEFLALAFGVVGPILVTIGVLCFSSNALTSFIEEQRRYPRAVEDITFAQLFSGLAIGAVSLCTFGVLTVALTVLKAPFVLIGLTAMGVIYTFPLLLETGCWFPVAFIGWIFAVAAGFCALVLGILLSVVAKFLLSLVWPAYVTAGWLRHVGRGGRRTGGSLCTPLVQGVKAGYQVLWAADLLTNVCVLQRFDLFEQTSHEFMEIAGGARQELSPECRTVACLPPVIVGLFQGDGWDMCEELIAGHLGVTKDAVREAWNSLAEQMLYIGRDALASELVTEDYVLGVPPELVIGLPARALLDTVERSPGADVVLATGLVLTEHKRPHGALADRAWEELRRSKAALPGLASAGAKARECLCGLLLAGGGDPGELPAGLARTAGALDELPPDAREAVLAVQRPLVALAVECSRQAAFKEKLRDLILAISTEGGGSTDVEGALVPGPGRV
jgi:hypothetical protein